MSEYSDESGVPTDATADAEPQDLAAPNVPNVLIASANPPTAQTGPSFVSNHAGSVSNTSRSPLSCSLQAWLADSLGNHTATELRSGTASPGSGWTDTAQCTLPAGVYQSGTQVTFTATTVVTDGTHQTRDVQSYTVTIP
ncbi:MAG: hypothetical protein M3320_06025 [Actinomycetota bacterium]|nr:hypothetical protein [Actinomycetota bacterium]MDQ5808216.1 hypothetical protein [Actinomycetota bacterium]